MPREDPDHRSESITLPPDVWDRLHDVAFITESTVGPRARPSWRRLLQRIARLDETGAKKLARLLPADAALAKGRPAP